MEEETYYMVNEVLQHSKRILLELQLYQGAGNAIREVMLALFLLLHSFIFLTSHKLIIFILIV